MKLQLILTPKLSIIALLRRNINVPRKLTTGARLEQAFFLPRVLLPSFGSALSIVGIPVAIPLGGVGGTIALVSSGLIFVSKKLDSKIKKHQEIVTLAIAKRDTVNRLLSKALSDNQISDSEFKLIVDESSQYNVLKKAVRSKITRNSSQPDIEKIKKDARSEVEAEFQKKINALVAGSN